MKYIDIYNLLKSKVNYHDDSIVIDDNILVRNFTFTSKNCAILPGESNYSCEQHNYQTDDCYNFDNNTGIISEVLDIHDSQVEDNITFRYHVFMPLQHQQEKSTEVVLMFHGFNEKTWYKYLPWAQHIVERTGKTVVLFPLAFHMNRAPQAWSDKRMMYEAAEQRKKLFPNILHSSLSNVAISTRMHAKPQRFLWSGLQSYYDVIQFIEEIKSGSHPVLAANASIDIFSYSIGSFLSQILMLTNYNDYFTNTKLAMFCGGPVFNRLSPVSKFILDSEANVNLYSFIVEHLDSHLQKDERMHHYMNASHPEGISLRSMLSYNTMSELRENTFRNMSDRVMAITLIQDNIIPSYEVVNTLQGRKRDIPIRVDEVDFPYSYKHEDPFPALSKIADEVDECFNKTFDSFCNFLK